MKSGVAYSFLASFLSSWVHAFTGVQPSCRYEPSCRHYWVSAIEKRGLFVGTGLFVRRILRCQPWGGSGWDPVPDKMRKQ